MSNALRRSIRFAITGVFLAIPVSGQAPSREVQPTSAAASPGAPNFGTQSSSYYTVDAAELSPDSSGFTYAGGRRRYLTNVPGFGLMAPLHLPSGAVLTFLQLHGYDASPTGFVKASIAVCDFTGQNCVYQVGSCGVIATVCSEGGGATGNVSLVASLEGDGIVIDNYFNRYFVVAGNTSNDGTTRLSQIIVGYRLQVSPAPPFASFTDVPTTHPFFQYVEALLASGITAGCGGFTFCPDAPLTRGQMAVFLSKALGLQWP